MKELSYEQALSRAASLCSTSEHCTSDIEDKLRRWGLGSKDIERAIEYLTDEKYIDNLRYSRAYSLDKMRYNHWGRIKIQQMLSFQKLSTQEIREGLSAIEEEEYRKILQEVAEAKCRTLKDEDPYIRQGKLIRHLLSRGFEMEQIMKAVSDHFS